MRCIQSFFGLWLALSVAQVAAAESAPSRCFGTVSAGRLEGAHKLPMTGSNFQAFSGAAAALGRTHLHSNVHAIMLAAYAELAERRPELRFVYGEGSWPRGGRLYPHRTHQNGSSVDFFVPVRDARGRSVPLPTSPFTRFGYDLEFDAQGRLGELSIDFEALLLHLEALDRSARARGSKLRLVILDTRYLPLLERSELGRRLRRSLPFMPRQAWVRHDEHYHVDFEIACAG
jgi:penicillin-insensitive murein DD-endopeptidase